MFGFKLRSPSNTPPSSPPPASNLPQQQSHSNPAREKAIQEIIDTENFFIKSLNALNTVRLHAAETNSQLKFTRNTLYRFKTAKPLFSKRS
mgnify:CR=1 FL=1